VQHVETRSARALAQEPPEGAPPLLLLPAVFTISSLLSLCRFLLSFFSHFQCVLRFVRYYLLVKRVVEVVVVCTAVDGS
jgi:hypothetical protein